MYKLNKYYKHSPTVLHKTQVLAAPTHYSMLMFTKRNKKVFFINVTYILKLDIIPDNVIEELSKVIAELLQVFSCLSLSLDIGIQLHRNFQMSVLESSPPQFTQKLLHHTCYKIVNVCHLHRVTHVVE